VRGVGYRLVSEATPEPADEGGTAA
jgi:hypothetical protein